MSIFWIAILVIIGFIFIILLATTIILLCKKCPETAKMLSNLADRRCEKCQDKQNKKYPQNRRRDVVQYMLTILKWGAIISIPVIVRILLEWKIRRHLPMGPSRKKKRLG